LNKLVGESEKTIKRIFAAAEKMAPSIIFIDEIDSMLTARS
jgi:SpoVK/Ycf46/Vps4 family AAA+-type ATPase